MGTHHTNDDAGLDDSHGLWSWNPRPQVKPALGRVSEVSRTTASSCVLDVMSFHETAGRHASASATRRLMAMGWTLDVRPHHSRVCATLGLPSETSNLRIPACARSLTKYVHLAKSRPSWPLTAYSPVHVRRLC